MKPIQKGDKIAVVAPAKQIDKESVAFAKAFFEEQGFVVELGKNIFSKHGYFAGTDEQRANDFQTALDNPKTKAIICARGGYGSIRILDRINWAEQLRNPKWIVGFSDVTVFQQHLLKYNQQSIHGTMPLNFKENSKEALSSLLHALKGENYTVKSFASPHNQLGNATGKLVGGNLSILYSLLGTKLQADYSNCILFIEEVGEQLYAVDRMLHSFKNAGILDSISGLIIGGMTNMEDTTPPSKLSVVSTIHELLQFSKIPICFDFPAGHIEDNQALILGKRVKLNVSSSGATVQF